MEICINISASTPAEYRDALNALNAGIQAPAVPAKPSPAPQAAPVQAHVPTDGEIPFTKPQRTLGRGAERNGGKHQWLRLEIVSA